MLNTSGNPAAGLYANGPVFAIAPMLDWTEAMENCPEKLGFLPV